MSTEAIHAGEMHDPSGAHIDPVHMTSTYVFEDVDAIGSWARGENEAHVYSRVGNPNRKALSTKLAALEGFGLDSPVSAEIFASGMGAVPASIMGFAGSGDHIVTQSVLYGTTNHLVREVLPNYGISSSRVPLMEPGMLEDELSAKPNAKVVYIETPANPTMAVIDIQATADIAHAHGARVVVDNTFATPILQRPLALGADAVIHSTTKFINGHGTVIGGALVSRDSDFIENGFSISSIHARQLCSRCQLFLSTVSIIRTRCDPFGAKSHIDNSLPKGRSLVRRGEIRATDP